MTPPYDFWLASGHHLLDRNADSRLCLTGDFLKAYLARPELVPPQEACSMERELHRVLLEDPWRAVTAAEIALIEDADARENWSVMIEWRKHLAGFDTIEAAYLDIVRRSLTFPNMFVGQLVHTILRNVLHDCEDVFVLRAAEMFFRPQKLTLQDGKVLAIDLEIAERHGDRRDSPLLAVFGLPPASGVDVLSESTSTQYWSRSDQFDTALDLTAGKEGLKALGTVIMRWVSHLLAVEVTVEPLAELHDATLAWYVGLSSEATRLGDILWNNEEIDEMSRRRLISLYRLTFLDPQDAIENVRGEPVYLMLAMGEDEVIRLKPQNLVTGLPLSQLEGSQLRSTALATIPIGVVVERRKARSPWADYLWRPISVLAGVPVTQPWTLIDGDTDLQLFYAGHAVIELYRTETVYYRENLTSGSPMLWVVLRPAGSSAELIAVTADPAEGEALTDAGRDIVETVAMPEPVALMLQDFIAAHHVERPFIKRRRTPSGHHVSPDRDEKEKKRDG